MDNTFAHIEIHVRDIEKANIGGDMDFFVLFECIFGNIMGLWSTK
jgi:hypothetical protein